ncbi:unnamed protein product [Closterium sp. Naga37s-1]|nr:unnamed protein product [Closterium sp. Naga37s-1]
MSSESITSETAEASEAVGSKPQASELVASEAEASVAEAWEAEASVAGASEVATPKPAVTLQPATSLSPVEGSLTAASGLAKAATNSVLTSFVPSRIPKPSGQRTLFVKSRAAEGSTLIPRPAGATAAERQVRGRRSSKDTKQHEGRSDAIPAASKQLRTGSSSALVRSASSRQAAESGLRLQRDEDVGSTEAEPEADRISGVVVGRLGKWDEVRSQRDGSGPVRSLRDGSGPVRSLRDGSGPERSQRDGSGPVRSRRDGSGPVRSQKDGSGLVRS